MGSGSSTATTSSAEQHESVGQLYISKPSGGWSCIFATCKAIVDYDPTYGLTLTLLRRTIASGAEDYGSEIRIRGEQLNFIREALGPLNEGVAFVCSPDLNATEAARPPTVYLFECAEDRELNEDPVIEALLKIRNIKAYDDDSKEGLLNRLSAETPVPPEVVASAVEVSKHTGKLLFYRQELSNFDVLADDASITIYQRAKYDDYLSIRAGRFTWLQKIGNSMHMMFTKGTNSFTWISQTIDRFHTFKVELTDGSFDAFTAAFSACLYESSSHIDFTKKVKEEDKHLIVTANQCDPDLSFCASDDEDSASNASGDEGDDGMMLEEADKERLPADFKDARGPAGNSFLAVANMPSNDRSFVSRGDKIGVFKTTEDEIKYSVTINVNSPRGKITPARMMLHQQDTKMILLDPHSKSSLYCMDVATETIVDEWKTDANGFTVNDVLPEQKYAQQMPVQTFLGINETSGFLIDPRLPSQKHSIANSFQYGFSTNAQLTCAATTGNGEFVTGSRTGAIRLMNDRTFTKPNDHPERRPRATTEFAGLGDPIIGVDVSEDGKWVLGTCDTYLLVFPTAISGKSGFQKKISRPEKEAMAAIKLRLKPEDVLRVGGEVHFTTAHFNARHVGTSEDSERRIITSTGRFVVTWNFRLVKQGRLQEYSIKEYGDAVVADRFLTGGDRAVVIATDSDVAIARARKRT